MSDLLSPEELNALLDSVSSGTLSDERYGIGVEGVSELDLANPDWFNRNQAPPLDFVNQMLERHLREFFTATLKKPLRVTPADPGLTSFADYMATLEKPTSIHLAHIDELDDNLIIVMSAQFVLNYVDFYYGGDGIGDTQEPRNFTITELGVAEKLYEVISRTMVQSWETVTRLTFEHAAHETNPRFSHFFDAADVLVTSRFEFSLDETSIGWLDIAIPKSALEPLHTALASSGQGDQQQKQSRWKAAFEERVRNAEIELSSNLATTTMTLGELVKMKAGDVLPLELPEHVELLAGEVPLFKGTFGVSNNKNAVQILERLR